MNAGRRWVALLALAAAASAVAQTPEPIVALTFVGEKADRAAFFASLGELLQRLHVELAARDTDAPLPRDRLLAAITADWSSPQVAVVTIVDPDEKVVLVRRLAQNGSRQLMIEAAAHIVHSVIEELLEPNRPIARRLPMPPLVSATTEPPAPTDGPGLDVGAFFGTRGLGNSAVAFGAGLQTELALIGGRWRPGLWLSGEYQAPIEANGPSVELSLTTVSFRAGPQLSLLNQPSWRLEAGLGGGADLFFTAPRSTVLPADRLKPARLDVAPVLSALLSLHVALARSADLSLSFTLDVDLAPPRYVADVGPVREELFSPWRVRPALLLGFSFSPVGPVPYQHRLGADR